MPLDKELLKSVAEAAAQREKVREERRKAARLEELHARIDPFLAGLPQILDSKGEARFFLSENQFFYAKATEAYVINDEAAKLLVTECRKLGLTAELCVDSDTVGYSVRTSGEIVVTAPKSCCANHASTAPATAEKSDAAPAKPTTTPAVKTVA